MMDVTFSLKDLGWKRCHSLRRPYVSDNFDFTRTVPTAIFAPNPTHTAPSFGYRLCSQVVTMRIVTRYIREGAPEQVCPVADTIMAAKTRELKLSRDIQ